MCFELLVYVGLAPGALSQNQLKALLACAPALGVDNRDWAATFYELSPPIRTPKLAYANFDEQLGG